MWAERRGCVIWFHSWVNPRGEEPMVETKPSGISKRAVWEAYRRVKEKRGAAGVGPYKDGQLDDQCLPAP